MAPFLKLHPHVSYGLVDSRPVFLDLQRDRYFALDEAGEAALGRAAQAGTATGCDRADIERLLATGLFSPSMVPAPLEPVDVVVPTRSALETTAARRGIGIGAAIDAHLSSRRARRAVRIEPLLRIVERERARRDGRLRVLGEDVEELAQSFRAARALTPGAQVCLPNALALLEWLARRSAYPALVFGVRLSPFGAHCWVQTNEAILTDAVDIVADFTPVLVVP
jgi:hypothetical protein